VVSSAQPIASALGFSLEELALNRAGHVSWRQLAYLFGWTLFDLFFTLFCVAILALVVAGKPRKLWMSVMYAVLSTGAGAIVGFLGWRSAADLFTRTVVVAEGPLRFQAGGRRAQMLIGAFRGSAPLHATTVLAEGAEYRLYYLARSGTFLSIEPVSVGSR
jgi:hypothetical protein